MMPVVHENWALNVFCQQAQTGKSKGSGAAACASLLENLDKGCPRHHAELLKVVAFHVDQVACNAPVQFANGLAGLEARLAHQRKPHTIKKIIDGALCCLKKGNSRALHSQLSYTSLDHPSFQKLTTSLGRFGTKKFNLSCSLPFRL